MTEIKGPNWDNQHEYADFNAPELQADLCKVTELITIIKEESKALNLTSFDAATTKLAQHISLKSRNLRILLNDLGTYTNCSLSVDGKNKVALNLQGKIQKLSGEAGAAGKQLHLWLMEAPEQVIELYLQDKETKGERYQIQQLRLLKPHKLSLAEEELLSALEANGPTAWGNLYNNLAASIQCDLEVEGEKKILGVAETSSLLESPSATQREHAYRALTKGWRSHEEPCSAILNALSGWRHTIYEKRSQKKTLHFLDMPLHQNSIDADILEAMVTAINEFKSLGQNVLKAHQKALKLDRLGPWDLFAPPPQIEKGEGHLYEFDEAIDLIKAAFSSIAPQMGDFVQTMVDNKWIEGGVGPTKRPGAYCTRFLKSRSPRVYMTYTGGMKDVLTLAHELGHAFHSWIIRDLSLPETNYPMTLAETASIMAETLVNDFLLQSAKTKQEQLNILWSLSRDAEAFILNIPARLTFEKRLYEGRLERTFTPEDLKELMHDAWKEWYGDSLCEYYDMFWASKLHFHIPGLSFYNFPYSFGYLFSLGVYSQRDKLKEGFFPAYVDLLRDTGRMTAAEVATKHLAMDLRQSDFWRSSLTMVEKSLNPLFTLVDMK